MIFLSGVIAIILSVGFDIDGVLTNDDNGEENIWITKAAEYFNKPVLRSSFNLDEAIGVSRQAIHYFLEQYGDEIMANVPIRSHAAEVIRELKAAGIRVHLITARLEKHRQLTKDWLAKHQIPYDSLTMPSSPHQHYSKGAKCRALGVEFFVDDHYDNCLDTYKAGITTLMFYTSHNRSKTPPVPVVRDWLEIRQYLESFISAKLEKNA